MNLVEKAKSLITGEGRSREPIGTVHVVDPSPLNWLYITYNTVLRNLSASILRGRSARRRCTATVGWTTAHSRSTCARASASPTASR